MSRPKITLFVDTVSPFAYEAFIILRDDPAFKSCDVTYVPIFLGGLMKACQNTPPIAVKNKDKWIDTERLRWARAFNIPIVDKMPPNFPPLTLNIMRALCAIPDQATFVRALDVLYRKYWVEGVPTHQPEVLKKVLGEVLGEKEAEKVLSDAATVGKKVLAENTDRAFAEGAFGLPWMACTDKDGNTQGFWGVDHLGQVAQFLGLDKPRTGGWKSLL